MQTPWLVALAAVLLVACSDDETSAPASTTSTSGGGSGGGGTGGGGASGGTGPMVCGDGTCDPSLESCETCDADCGACAASCNDANCDAGEDCTNCPDDCGICQTCSDGIRNQDETGIDCGGTACAPCPLIDPCEGATACIYADHSVQDCTDYDPATRSCGAGTARAFAAIQDAVDELQPGMALVVREGVYREEVVVATSGTEEQPITIAAFPGEEGSVVVNAADELGGWTACASQGQCGGNENWQQIHHVVPGFDVVQLFQNGTKLKPSRYPDAGWRTTTWADGARTYADSTLSFPDDYFVGATSANKTWPWHLDLVEISDSNPDGTIVLVDDPNYSFEADDGYYIFNIVPEINEPGEWAYDRATGRLFVWPQDDLSGLEASRRDTCVTGASHLGHWRIAGLTCLYPRSDGVRFVNSTSLTVELMTIESPFKNGIVYNASVDGRILHNVIRHANVTGITDEWGLSDEILIQGNYIYATGAERYGDDLLAGRGEGIYCRGNAMRVVNNIIEKTGYNGISLRWICTGNDLSFNYVSNTHLSLADGGGLYTDGYDPEAATDFIHHNIFENAHGYTAGFHDWSLTICDDNKGYDTCTGYVQGIYNDERGSDIEFADNTVIHSFRGMFFHWAADNEVTGNTFYGNQAGQIYLNGRDEDRYRLDNDNLLGNILFSTAPDQTTFRMRLDDYTNLDFGSSDDNYFYNPYNDRSIRVGYPGYDEHLTLAEFQALVGKDANSKAIGPVYSTAHADNQGNRDSIILFNREMSDKQLIFQTPLCDLDGAVVTEVLLEPFTSKVLLRCFCNGDGTCNNQEDAESCPADC